MLQTLQILKLITFTLEDLCPMPSFSDCRWNILHLRHFPTDLISMGYFFCCSGNQLLGWHNRPPLICMEHSIICFISSQEGPIDVNYRVTQFVAIYKISHLQHHLGWSPVDETMLEPSYQNLKYIGHGVSLLHLEDARLLLWTWEVPFY